MPDVLTAPIAGRIYKTAYAGPGQLAYDSLSLHPLNLIGDNFGAPGFDLTAWKAGVPARYSIYQQNVAKTAWSDGELSLLPTVNGVTALDIAAPITPARRILYARILMRVTADINHNVPTWYITDNGSDYNISAIPAYSPTSLTWCNPYTGSTAGGPVLSDDQKLTTTHRSVVLKFEAPIGAHCIATEWCNGRFIRKDTGSVNGDVGIGCFEPFIQDHYLPSGPSTWCKLWECVDGANGSPYSGLEAVP